MTPERLKKITDDIQSHIPIGNSVVLELLDEIKRLQNPVDPHVYATVGRKFLKVDDIPKSALARYEKKT